MEKKVKKYPKLKQDKLKLKVIPISQKGTWDEKYKVWRQTEEEEKRGDISPQKMYLVSYNGIWLIGRFKMAWYGWNFEPNMGSMSMQIEWLKEIYEIEGLSQKKGGSTEEHILDYLEEERDGKIKWEDWGLK